MKFSQPVLILYNRLDLMANTDKLTDISFWYFKKRFVTGGLCKPQDKKDVKG